MLPPQRPSTIKGPRNCKGGINVLTICGVLVECNCGCVCVCVCARSLKSNGLKTFSNPILNEGLNVELAEGARLSELEGLERGGVDDTEVPDNALAGHTLLVLREGD